MAILKTASTILIISLCISILPGCTAIKGQTIITYHSEYNATVQASADALDYLEILILDKVSDELKTEFLARRPDGTPVTVEVTRVEHNFTRVAISTGGGVDRYLEKQVPNQIHGFIRGKLSSAHKED